LSSLGEQALVLDSGNALFRVMGGASDEDKRRAAFVLDTMGALRTAVLGVGFRDLSGGPEFLTAEAKKANVQLVSTNLELNGKPAFPRSALVERNGVKVAVLAASGTGAVPGAPGLVGVPPLAAIRAELERLPARDLTVLISAAGYEEAIALANELSGTVDLVIQSGEFRGTVPPQPIKDAVLLASGQRGQAVGKLSLTLGAPKGPFTDLNEAARDKELLAHLDRQLKALDERLAAATDAAAKKSLAALRTDMKTRRDAQAKKVKAVQGARTLELEWVLLGTDVKDDAAVKAKVLEIEPTYSGLH
jgi:2',3'-cyclic-nucleotide 2'-phosphodiesterase (5'-nucleotidase family)